MCEGDSICSARTWRSLALATALLVSLHQSDPLGLNATPLPQESSLVETPPPAENKPRKRQLSGEQPSGNGVKKPKVSGGGCTGRNWLVSSRSIWGQWVVREQMRAVWEPQASPPTCDPSCSRLKCL